MRKMYIAPFFALLMLVSVSCAKKQPSAEYIYAASLHKNYAAYYYKGEKSLADITFYKAVDAFQRMDSPCNISRLYISKYSLAEKEADIEDLKLAFSYADTGLCKDELLIASFLAGEYVGSKNRLEEPFEQLFLFEKTEKYSSVISYAGNKNTDPASAARLYRHVADKLIDTDPKKAYGFAEKAWEIDSTYGWTLGLSRDLDILIAASEKLGEDTTILRERKRLIDLKLSK